MTKKPRSTEGLSTLDDFLAEEGTREAFQAVAVKCIPLRELKPDQPLQDDIATGLADVAAGRVKDFDAPLIVEGRKLLAKRRSFLTGELSDEEAEAIASSRMNPRHDNLNKLLDRK
jgi:hypothetical protein